MDFVTIFLVYDDWVEMTEPMQRWLADVFCSLFAQGYQWTPGYRVCRALVIPA